MIVNFSIRVRYSNIVLFSLLLVSYMLNHMEATRCDKKIDGDGLYHATVPRKLDGLLLQKMPHTLEKPL